jgi:excisionase family DNA binding protein
MTALARTANTPLVDSQLIKVLHAAVDGLAKALGAQVNAVIAQQLERQAASKTIEQKIAAAMPELVEQAFIAGFLQNEKSARHSRAMLAHFLSAAELQSFAGSPLKLPVSVLPIDVEAENADELTSEAAAKLLHVSRTHLNTLVDTGQLGEVRRTPGGHRRISKAAVLRYKAASKERQAKGLDAMVEASERLGLYDEELAGVPVRAKR